jgi:hypothetical protein
MRIPACIFTYSGAALRLPWAVRGALIAGFIPVVCQDAAAPLPGHVLGWLATHGIEVRTTTFPRNGNLNGIACAAGICRELEAACERYGSTNAIKLDDDTAVIDPKVFTNHLGFAAVGLTWHAGARPGAYGLAYCLRRDTAAQVASWLEAWPVPDEMAPEDLTIWWLAKRHGHCLDHAFHPQAGPWSGLPLGADAWDGAVRFSVLTVGNEPPQGWRDRPRQMAVELRRVVEAAGRLHGRCRPASLQSKAGPC